MGAVAKDRWVLGAVIHGYRIDQALSEDKGGFGDVYFATHTESGAGAVVKALKPQLSAQREIVKRFFNEARAAASIHHPGIVSVHNVGYHEDRAYLLMERLRGEDLETRLRRGPLAVAQALLFVRQAAGAIGAAHDRGIVHRDLKPANLFVVADPDVVGGERIKVLDFGIAKLTHDTGTMKTQGVFGTPAYMAPEQCASTGDVDARADLYALGCILFELIAGKPPFGHGGLELVAAHLRDEPPLLRAVAPGASPAVEAIVARLLRKEPAQRHASCAELIAAIDQAGRSSTANAAPVSGVAATVAAFTGAPVSSPSTLGSAAGAMTSQPPTRGTPWLALGVVALLLVGGGAFAWVALRDSSDEDARSADRSVPEAPLVAVHVVDAAPVAKPPPVDVPVVAPADATPAPITGPGVSATVRRPKPSPDAGAPPVDKLVVKPKKCPDEVACLLMDDPPRCCHHRGPGVEPPPLARDVDAPPEDLDKAMVADGVAKVKGRILACGDKYPDVTGTVRLGVKVNGAGEVTSVTVKETPDAALGDCAAAAMKKASFGETQKGGSFSYPFSF